MMLRLFLPIKQYELMLQAVEHHEYLDSDQEDGILENYYGIAVMKIFHYKTEFFPIFVWKNLKPCLSRLK